MQCSDSSVVCRLKSESSQKCIDLQAQHHTETESLTQEVSNLKLHATQAISENKSMHEQVKGLKADLIAALDGADDDSIKQQSDQMEHLHEKTIRLEQELQHQQSENLLKQNQLDKIKEFYTLRAADMAKEDQAKSKQAEDNAEKAREKVEQQFHSLEQQHRTATDQFESKISVTTNQVHEATAANADLQEQLNNLKLKLANAHSTVQHRDDQLKEETDKNEQLQAKLDSMQREVSRQDIEKRQELSELRSEVSVMHERYGIATPSAERAEQL